MRCLVTFSQIIAITFLLHLSPSAYATTDSTKVGVILSVEGKVSITPSGGSSTEAKLDSLVHLHDTIATGERSRAFILLDDETEIVLSENTRLKIDEFVFDPEEDSSNKARYSLLEGAFKYLSGLIGKKKNPNVSITTNYGSLGIRGTELWSGTLNGEFGVYVHEGKVKVSNESGQVELTTGLGTSIQSHKMPPSMAQAWGRERLAQIKNSVHLKQQELIRKRIEKIKSEQKAIKQRRQAEIKRELRALIQQKHQEIKAEVAQFITERQKATQLDIQQGARGIILPKLQEVKSIQQQGQQLKHQMSQAQSPSQKRDIAQRMKQLGQHAKQRIPQIQQEAKDSIQQLVASKTESLKREIQAHFEQVHQQAKRDVEDQIKRLQREKGAEILAEMQNMLKENQTELKAQLEQLHSEARQQVDALLQDLRDSQK